MSDFRFIGGVLCLDFVNTCAWVNEEPVNDRFIGNDSIYAWAREAKIAEGRRNDRAYLPLLAEHARELRALLRRILVPLAHGDQPTPRALSIFERHTKRAFGEARFEVRPSRLRLAWPGDAAGAGVLERVTWSALSLVRSPRRLGMLRECGGDGCG